MASVAVTANESFSVGEEGERATLVAVIMAGGYVMEILSNRTCFPAAKSSLVNLMIWLLDRSTVLVKTFQLVVLMLLVCPRTVHIPSPELD